MMPAMLHLSRNQWAALWPTFIMVVTVCAIIAGVRLTVAEGVLLLLASVAPPVLLLLIWRGPPPPTVAELLYSASTSTTRGESR